MIYLDNTEIYYEKTLKYSANNRYNHCDYCKSNCHDPCDCFGNTFGRCMKFPIFYILCEECGHPKDQHKIDNYYYYTEKKERKNKNNSNYHEIQKEKLSEEINRKKSRKNKIRKSIK